MDVLVVRIGRNRADRQGGVENASLPAFGIVVNCGIGVDWAQAR